MRNEKDALCPETPSAAFLDLAGVAAHTSRSLKIKEDEKIHAEGDPGEIGEPDGD